MYLVFITVVLNCETCSLYLVYVTSLPAACLSISQSFRDSFTVPSHNLLDSFLLCWVYLKVTKSLASHLSLCAANIPPAAHWQTTNHPFTPRRRCCWWWTQGAYSKAVIADNWYTWRALNFHTHCTGTTRCL